MSFEKLNEDKTGTQEQMGMFQPLSAVPIYHLHDCNYPGHKNKHPQGDT